jgi:hypothetical protein
MRQDPIAFSRRAVVTAVSIVVALVVFGAGGAWLTIAAGGGSLSALAAAQQGGAAVPPPHDIEGIYQTLIERDETTANLRRDDERRLTSYGWIDRSQGVVHIPIARAMQLVAEEGQ